MTNTHTAKEINKIIEENKRLKAENKSMQKILDSKRFRAAEKMANTFNVVFPDHSLRRKSLKTALAPIRKIRSLRGASIQRKIKSAVSGFNKVVVIHSIPWDTPLKQRPQHLAKCLSEKGIFVIFFEPDEPIHTFRRVTPNIITVNSWDVIYNIMPTQDKKYYFFFNNVLNIDYETVKKLDEHGFNIVYEYIDEFHEDISGSMLNQLETWEKLPELKPLVLASATKLYNEAKKHFKKSKVILSKNAVNVEDFDFHKFSDIKAPNDLSVILESKKPIAGYYGAIAPWLDYELISDSARQNPDIEFVFLGVDYQHALEKLDTTIPNIHYLGSKDYAELPKYSAFFNCAIIPFSRGEIAKGTSPVKLFEYMAMGLPTVGTKDLKECEGYKHIYLAKNSKEFGDFIKIGIKEHEIDQAREELFTEAQKNAWQSRANDIIKAL